MPTLTCDEMRDLVTNLSEQIISKKTINRSQKLSRIDFKDGSYYEGEFGEDGQINGEGKLTIPDKTVFEGTFINNQPKKGELKGSGFKYEG